MLKQKRYSRVIDDGNAACVGRTMSNAARVSQEMPVVGNFRTDCGPQCDVGVHLQNELERQMTVESNLNRMYTQYIPPTGSYEATGRIFNPTYSYHGNMESLLDQQMIKRAAWKKYQESFQLDSGGCVGSSRRSC